MGRIAYDVSSSSSPARAAVFGRSCCPAAASLSRQHVQLRVTLHHPSAPMSSLRSPLVPVLSSDLSANQTPAPPLPRYTSPTPSFSGAVPSAGTPSFAQGWARDSGSATAFLAATAAANVAGGEVAGQKELRNEIASLQVRLSISDGFRYLFYALCSVQDTCSIVQSLAGSRAIVAVLSCFNSVKLFFLALATAASAAERSFFGRSVFCRRSQRFA